MKRLILLASFMYLIFSAYWSFAFDPGRPDPNRLSRDDIVKRTEVDLNGDDKIDRVSIEIKQLGNFSLRVDKVAVKGKLCDKVTGFGIIDIDTTDKYKEIAVHTPGPSDDDEYLIYWYDGKLIREMGRLSRWTTFFGNGIVHVDDWMGFWSKKEKYVLNKKTRTLQLIPQELYYVGIEAKVIESFPIYKTRTSSDIVAHLKAKSKILILACDPSPTSNNKTDDYFLEWYLIKSGTGLVGWARLKSFWDKLEGLPWAD